MGFCFWTKIRPMPSEAMKKANEERAKWEAEERRMWLLVHYKTYLGKVEMFPPLPSDFECRFCGGNELNISYDECGNSYTLYERTTHFEGIPVLSGKCAKCKAFMGNFKTNNWDTERVRWADRVAKEEARLEARKAEGK